MNSSTKSIFVFAEVEERKVDHPDFHYASAVGEGGFPVCIFNRNHYDTDAVAFTKADCEAMVEAVKKAFPEFEIRSTWNGASWCSFSVSIKPKGNKSEPSNHNIL
jgi:hypothetical protein